MRRAAAVVGALLLGAIACSTQKSTSEPAKVPVAAAAPQPVVGIYTPTPLAGEPGAAPTLAVRPVGNPAAASAAKKAGKDVGPVVTFAGIARADGGSVAPAGKSRSQTREARLSRLRNSRQSF